MSKFTSVWRQMTLLRILYESERGNYIHIHTYEIYNALHSRGWLESEARAVARWRGLGRNGREVECF